MNAKAFSGRYVGKARGRGYEMWREEFARRWLSIDFVPVAGDCIANEASYSEHSFLGLCAMRGTPIRMERRTNPARDDMGIDT